LYFVSLDTGGAKRIERYADYFKKAFGLCFKQRGDGPDNIKRMLLLGDVKGKDVVMIDDIIDTAGSVKKFVDLVWDAGAKSITCFFTHAMLSGPAYERIISMPNVQFIVTDTLPIPQKFLDLPNFRVITTSDLLAEVIDRDVKNASISSLFVF
jgi:ribose-phosphate pyrophosphokinase